MTRAVSRGEPLKRSNQVLMGLFGLVSVIVITASMGTSFSTGMDTELAGGVLPTGATCHDVTASSNVEAILEGVPGNYSMAGDDGSGYHATTYELTVRILGGPNVTAEAQNQGGFNLLATGGTLEAIDDTVHVTNIGEATHTTAGNDQREWKLRWTSPEDPDEAVMFRLTVNAVNGDGQAGPEDQWNRARVVSEGLHGASIGGGGEGGIHVEKIGVNWLAYWVGIASFVFMVGLMVIFYFVFRYSESANVTDHRARKAKGK